MDKNSAINLIKDTFNAKFDEKQFTLFIKNFLNELEPKSNSYSGNLLWDDYKEHINSYKRIGKYIDPDGDALDVLIVQVKTVTKLQKARTTLRNFVIKHLSKFDKDYALVAFYSKEDEGADWRFSFIKLEHQSYLDEEKQKVKTRKEFTPAKRYSFLVGEYEDSHTAKNQLLPLLQNIASNPTLEELETAFSIEKVTDEFFGQYKDLFIKLSSHFENDEHVKAELKKANIDNSRFTKKLLGQIVFLYFLQKKGWLGVPKNQTWGKGDKRFIQDLYTEAQNKGANYFKDYLQPLFYEALAKERNNENSYYKKFNCRIPFLNGGLFEAEYDWKNANITIPENLFRNTEKNKAGDKGTGVLDVFDRYNFTIKEDEPLDKEVAVDPEMLGKVFENMLDITERKSKGAFYTPREIVHYMCQESLIHYLDNSLNDYSETYQELGNDQLNLLGNKGKKGQQTLQTSTQSIKVKKADIETYIREGHFALENDQRVANKGETKTYKYQIPESIRQNADLIDQKLTEIRICDPAIGSGAFPVGLLHELVNAQLVLKPHLSNAYLNKKLDSFGFEFHESINESRYVYRLKRHIIQESIYGVDIDASAIDIARLRLWLSLVVDEDDFDPIETLPNLDYKIVCGNSLIGMPENSFRDLEVEKELEALKERFYNETNESKKKALRTEINSKIRELLDSAESFAGYKIDFDFKLYFSEVWHEKGGFDVVIGNPPYVSAWEMTKTNPETRKTLTKVFAEFKDVLKGHWDLFIPFLLKGNKVNSINGATTFILPNPVLREKYAYPVREFIINKANLISILHFDESNVFKKVSRKAAVLFFAKSGNEPQVKIFRNSTWGASEQVIFLDRAIKKEIFKNNDGCKYTIDIDNNTHILLDRIVNESISLGSVFHVNYGAQVSSKISGLYKKSDVVTRVKTGNAKKFIEGKDIARFKIRYRNLWLDYRKDTMYGSRSESLFENDKIIFRKVSDKGHKLALAIDYNQFYTDDGCVIALPYESVKDLQQSFKDVSRIYNQKYSIEFVFGCLVSSITTYYFKNKFATESLQGATSHTYPKSVRQLPILKSLNSIQSIEIIISYLSLLTEGNSDIQLMFYKELLDGVIFENYFSSELIKANKEILKHLGDLKPIKDEMSEEEKLAIIQSEFERLYDPNHPVRNNIETLDSIEEVRIIKEALK